MLANREGRRRTDSKIEHDGPTRGGAKNALVVKVPIFRPMVATNDWSVRTRFLGLVGETSPAMARGVALRSRTRCTELLADRMVPGRRFVLMAFGGNQMPKRKNRLTNDGQNPKRRDHRQGKRTAIGSNSVGTHKQTPEGCSRERPTVRHL